MSKPRVHQTEAQLKVAVIAALKSLFPKLHVRRENAGKMPIGKGRGRRFIDVGEAGTPDLMVMLPRARVVWLELKTKVGKMSPSQVAWHDMADKLEHEVYVVRTVDEAVMVVRAALEDAVEPEASS